jgi:phosphatidylserine/phosphatidylglycerophosphate/cardiolipin synthase-like enzyme
MFFIKDKILYEKLNNLFLWDFEWKLVYVYDDDLIISPDYSRIKLEKIILESNKTINMYFPYLSDNHLLDLLIKQRQKWVEIKLILGKDSDDDLEDINELKQNNIEVKIIKNPKIHAKAILIDEKYLYLWSINFSKYSLDENREIWVVFSNNNTIKKFINIFKSDFEK